MGERWRRFSAWVRGLPWWLRPFFHPFDLDWEWFDRREGAPS